MKKKQNNCKKILIGVIVIQVIIIIALVYAIITTKPKKVEVVIAEEPRLDPKVESELMTLTPIPTWSELKEKMPVVEQPPIAPTAPITYEEPIIVPTAKEGE